MKGEVNKASPKMELFPQSYCARASDSGKFPPKSFKLSLLRMRNLLQDLSEDLGGGYRRLGAANTFAWFFSLVCVCSAMEFGGGGSRKSSRDEKSKTRRVLPRVPSDVAPVLPQSSRSSSRRSSQAQDSSLDLTNVTDLSQTSVLEAGSIIGGAHPPRRDFVSPVKLVSAEDGVDSSVTVAVRVRPLSDRYAR